MWQPLPSLALVLLRLRNHDRIGMLAAIVLGFLSALLGGARCAQLGATLVPNEVFYRQLGPDAPLSVFAPGVELAGGSTLLRCNSTASSAVACATACMDSDSCDVWGFTEGAVSSSQVRN